MAALVRIGKYETGMSSDAVETQTTYETPAQEIDGELHFDGFRRNVVAAVGLIAGGGLAFTMNLTNTFFAEATAWVFLAWGVLLLFTNLLEMFEHFIVREDALVIGNPFRLWARKKVWNWSNIERVDIWVRRFDPTYENVYLQVYYNANDELDPGTRQREDTRYRTELAALIIERAGLKPEAGNPTDLTDLPKTQPARYKWS